MIATVANNLECYLKIQNIKFEKTQKGNHLIIYLGYEYLIKSANKKFIHLSCRDNCSGRAKLSLKDIIITIEHTAKCKFLSNGIPHLEPQVSPIVPDISISSNGIPHLEPQVSPIVPDTNLDSPLDIAQALLDLNSNIYEARFVKSQKGKMLLFFQNYLYRFHCQNRDIIKYRCRVADCHAKCIFDGAYIALSIHDQPFEIGTFEMLKTKEALENIVA
ncbi:unnamed protein product [Gordionus sp. m RMFG-2023]